MAQKQTNLVTLAQLALTAKNLDVLFEKTAEILADNLKVQYVAIWELLPNQGTFLLRTGIGWPAEIMGKTIISGGKCSQAGYTLESKQAVVVSDLLRETRFSSSVCLSSHGAISSITVPISQQKSFLGVLGVYTKTKRKFSDNEVDFLANVANLLDSAIEQRDRARELKLFWDVSLDLFAIAGKDGYFKRINPRFSELLGYSDLEILSRPFLDFVHPEDRASTVAEMEKLSYGLPTINFENRYRCQDGTYRWLSWKARPFGENLIYAVARDITEKKQVEAALIESGARCRQQAQYERLLKQTALQIRQSLDVNQILKTTVSAVRDLLKCDRVLIYQFAADFSGTIIAESVGEDWTVSLTQKIEDTCFPTGKGENYLEGQSRVINDIYQANLSPCHLALLEQFEIKANLVVPIFRRESVNHSYLWGLLIAHQCDAPREWQSRELQLLEEIAIQLSIALQQSQLYQQAQKEISERRRAETELKQLNHHLEEMVADRTTALIFANEQLQRRIQQLEKTKLRLKQENLKSRLFAEIAVKIRQSLDFEEILQTTITEVQEILKCDRVLIYRILPHGGGCVFAEKCSFPWTSLLNLCLLPEVFPWEDQQAYLGCKIRAIDDVDIYWETVPCLGELMQEWQVKAKLVVPLLSAGELWGFLIAHNCRETRQWSQFEIELMGQIAEQVGVAIAQSDLLKELEESQHFIQHITDAIPSILYLYDLEKQKNVYVNQQITKILGYTPAEIQEMGDQFFSLLMHPQDLARISEHLARLEQSKDKEVFELEYRMKDRQGNWHWLLSQDTIFARTCEGKVKQILGTATDITERKQVEKNLKLSEDALAASSNGIIIADATQPNFPTIYVNPAFEQITGYTAAEIIGKNALFLPDAQSNPSELARLKNTLEAQANCTVVLRNYRQDGTFFWNELSVSPIYDSDQKLSYFLGVQNDITVSKKIQKNLESTTSRLSTLMENLQLGVLVKDDLDQIVLINQAFCDLFDIDIIPASLIGADGSIFAQEYQDLFANPQEFIQRHQEIKRQRKIITNEEISLADGRIFERDYIPINVDGNHQGHLWMYRDISERKEAEQKILTSLKEKEILLKEIHHRVKNNLYVISSLLNLQSHSLEDEKILALFRDSQRRIQTMAMIHEQLYQSNDLGKINFAEYLERLVNNLFISYQQSAEIIPVLDVESVYLNLETAIPCGLLINELVTNCFKHAFPKNCSGTIKLQLRVIADKQLQLIVSDNGIGIPTGVNWEESPSLGLRLVRILAQQLDACLTLDNSQPGTSFSLVFAELKYQDRV